MISFLQIMSGLFLPVSVIILVAASTTQLSFMIVSNGSIAASNNVYAQIPPGPSSPPGLDKELQVRTVRGDTVIVPANLARTATASCASDEFATGGGHEIRDLTNEKKPTISSDAVPDDAPYTWSFSLANPGPDEVVIGPFAVCAELVNVP
jgi:hypothetical protein